MPNWCFTNLSITGPTEGINRFKAGLIIDEKGNLESSIMNTYYPCPQELRDTVSGYIHPNSEGHLEWEKQKSENMKNHGYTDWYEWCCDKWGSKWGDTTTVLESSSENELVFSFNTAWSPIETGIQYVSLMFPTLTFIMEVDEESGEYTGIIAIKNGDTIYEDTFCGHEVYQEVSDSNPDLEDYDEIDEIYRERKESMMSEVSDKFNKWMASTK